MYFSMNYIEVLDSSPLKCFDDYFILKCLKFRILGFRFIF